MQKQDIVPIVTTTSLVAILNDVQFPVKLEDSEISTLTQMVKNFDITEVELRELPFLCQETTEQFGKVLDSFLLRISKFDNPEVFKVMDRLEEVLDAENLETFVNELMSEKPGRIENILNLLSSKKAIEKKAEKKLSELTKQLAGKTTSLVNNINALEDDAKSSCSTLVNELKNLEELKKAYNEQFKKFIIAVAYIKILHKTSSDKIDEIKKSVVMDIGNTDYLEELDVKLNALSNLALVMETSLTRIPLTQVVIRQIQDAGISSLQEISIKLGPQINSIKETLLTLNGALTVKKVQNASKRGDEIEKRLHNLSNIALTQITETAATESSQNRLTEAQQLLTDITTLKGLMKITRDAKPKNSANLTQARSTLVEAQNAIMQINQ